MSDEINKNNEDKWNYAWKALYNGATHFGNNEFRYNLPLVNQKWSDWTEAPNAPMIADGKLCAPGRLHLWKKPSLQYSKPYSSLWLARYKSEDILGDDIQKIAVRKLQLCFIPYKTFLHIIRRGLIANLENANLRNANLRNANLRNANLENANLENANLINANLINANLRYANLRYANLRNASLEDADLRNASLEDADLEDANLENANLRYASLEDADLRNANLRYANLINANLEDSIMPNGKSYQVDMDLIKFTK